MGSPPLYTLRLRALPSQLKFYAQALLPPTMSAHDDNRGTMTQPDPDSTKNGNRYRHNNED